jgi:hypothetical protein
VRCDVTLICLYDKAKIRQRKNRGKVTCTNHQHMKLRLVPSHVWTGRSPSSQAPQPRRTPLIDCSAGRPILTSAAVLVNSARLSHNQTMLISFVFPASPSFIQLGIGWQLGMMHALLVPSHGRGTGVHAAVET